MTLQDMLTRDYAANHAAELAHVVEALPPREVADVFKGLPLETAATLSGQMTPAAVAQACEQCEDGLTVGILSRLSVAAALPILRRLTPTSRTAILDGLPTTHGHALREALDYPPGSAGALMDPSLLAFPSDLTAADTLEAVKRNPVQIHYNLYVVDRNHVLIGALNLQELLLAPAGERLDKIMKQPVQSLDVGADSYTVIRHPGWRQVYSLPVVDGDGRFVGAIRYRMLRQLEMELKRDETSSEAFTIHALSGLFGAGMGGFVNALATGITWGAGDSSGSGRTDLPEK